MKAVGYKKSLPIDAADALFDFETDKPPLCRKGVAWNDTDRPRRITLR
mgnify:CR=1 FL=1